VFGGVSQFGQVKDIKKGAETVIACPGRLIDLMTQGILYLDQVECFVLDEADRMLDMGFLPDIKRIISKLPKSRQSLFFSATLSPQIMKLAGELVRDPVQITLSPETPTVEKINQKVMFVEKAQKDDLLKYLLAEHPEWTKVIVFTKMRHGADRVVKKLLRADVSCAAIHSDKTQNQRTRALEGFRRGQTRVLVATDIASRGIDVPDVSCVINMELPLETESYVHRIGRTARAGESGAAISFVTADGRGQLKAVERFIKKSIPVDRDHPYHSPFVDKASGKAAEGLEQAPWVQPANRNKANRQRRKRTSYLGRRQPDFGQK
jgi:ATP-dependent RNA helicase RhlE